MMTLAQKAGKVPLLPQVTAPMPPGIQVLRIAPMNSPEQHRQRIRPLRHHHQVDMIGHQAVSQNAAFRVGELFPHQRQVHLIVGRAIEHSLAITPPLGDVIR